MKRRTVNVRKIDSPVISLDTEDEVHALKTEPEWIAGERNGITLAKYPHMRVVLVALRRGTSLREHKVEGPMALYLLSGKVSVTVRKTRYQVQEGGLFTLRKTVPHDVEALEDSAFLLTIMHM
jgi:quercetin dioxygenase-like cupin family protein